jgi:mRNA interferase MazF
VLGSVTCAPITRTRRGIESEVEVWSTEGLPERSVINCDTVLTVPKSVLARKPVGSLGKAKRAELDRALRYALGIPY